MLQQISWSLFLMTAVVLLIIYYGSVAILYYRTEIAFHLERFSGKGNTATQNTHILPMPEYDIVGAVANEVKCGGDEDELLFAPDDADEHQIPAPAIAALPNSQVISEFSAMIGEIKTLIRVIIESSETKENFEMLFRLIVHKYPGLAGTDYQAQVNAFLIDESAGSFEFALHTNDLNEYWKINRSAL